MFITKIYQLPNYKLKCLMLTLFKNNIIFWFKLECVELLYLDIINKNIYIFSKNIAFV